MNRVAKMPNEETYTVATRLQVGFPENKEEWIGTTAEFSPDGTTLTIMGHPVMESWEEPYMKQLASIATKNGGRILEVGFGLGISARFVQASEIVEHVIIEANLDVLEKAKSFAEGSRFRVTLLHGLWESVVHNLSSNSFDGILFDTYPLNSEEIHCNHFPFFPEAYRLLKPGGILTYYSDEVADFSPSHLQVLKEAGFRNIGSTICQVSPPVDCEYWRANTIMAPIVYR